MLDKHYDYQLANGGFQREFNPEIICRIYRFDTDKNRRYHVEIDQLPHEFYLIKFFPIHMTRARNRYRCILNDRDAFAVLGTCIKILTDHLARNPNASFGFMGVPKSFRADDQYTIDDFNYTARYRVYLHAVVNRLGSKTFQFTRDEKTSSFCAINRKRDCVELRKVIQEAFDYLVKDMNATVHFIDEPAKVS